MVPAFLMPKRTVKCMAIPFEQAVKIFAQNHTKKRFRRIARLIRGDGGPGSGNFGHRGVVGQIGGSAPGHFSSKQFKSGDGDFEITQNVSDMCLTDTARKRISEVTARVKTANDLEEYLKGKNIKLSTSCKALKDRWNEEIPSVKRQEDFIIAAVEQYEELGGLSALKEIHFYQTDMGGRGEFSFRMKGEQPVSDEGHIYLGHQLNGFQIMHEFAHAFAESTKPDGMDNVEWSAMLNKDAGIHGGAKSYFGANSDHAEAEKFANEIGGALAYGSHGRNGKERVEFLVAVANIASSRRSDGGPGSGNFGHAGVPGKVGGSAPGNGSRAVVEGKDISGTYKGDKDIRSVIREQGFDGLPKIVGSEEFDKAVKASGFIAQRAYGADSKEVLEMFHDQLYNGEWYIDCSVGGGVYGKGMYSSSDYNGELSDTTKRQSEFYGKYGKDMNSAKQAEEKVLRLSLKDARDTYGLSIGGLTEENFDLAKRYNMAVASDEEEERYENLFDDDAQSKLDKWFSRTESKIRKEADSGQFFSRTETFTLDPGAKIITYKELKKLKDDYSNKTGGTYETGAFAAMLGFDAICVDGKDTPGCETIILNRTKVIFKEDEGRKDGADKQIYFQYDNEGNIWAIREKKVVGRVITQDPGFVSEELKDIDPLPQNTDRSDEDPASWITLENGQHVPLNESGQAIGGAGGWATGKDFTNAKSEKRSGKESVPKGAGSSHSEKPDRNALSDSMKPHANGYNTTLDDSFNKFVAKNMGNSRNPKALYQFFHDIEDSGGDGFEAVKDEYYKTRLEMCTEGIEEIGRDKADEILYDKLSGGTVNAWFREYNHEVKDSLVYQLTQSPEVHNAALNVMYENYKYQCQYDNQKALPFNEFLVTPIKMFRGGTGEEYEEASPFSSYTFSRKVAESFTGSEVGQGHAYDPNGVVYEAEIRPIDTYGSVFANGESEILIPRMIAPNGKFDSKDKAVSGRTAKIMSAEELRFRLEMPVSEFSYKGKKNGRMN